MIETTGKTYRTTDYDLFKRLEGNREVLKSRINKIKKSICKYGYVYNPIVVNEKYEIIDGQGRFGALKELELPIDFVIAPGTGLNDCIALNASGTIWTLKDYIASYSEQGNENYIRMYDLVNSSTLNMDITIMLITGLAGVPNDIIKSGRMILPEEIVPRARKNLAIAQRFKPILKQVKGSATHYFYAIVFAVQVGADENRIYETMEKSVISPAPDLRTALDKISDIYNKSLKKNENKIYLFPEYEQSMTNKYGWYAAKWGNKHDN